MRRVLVILGTSGWLAGCGGGGDEAKENAALKRQAEELRAAIAAKEAREAVLVEELEAAEAEKAEHLEALQRAAEEAAPAVPEVEASGGGEGDGE